MKVEEGPPTILIEFFIIKIACTQCLYCISFKTLFFHMKGPRPPFDYNQALQFVFIFLLYISVISRQTYINKIIFTGLLAVAMTKDTKKH